MKALKPLLIFLFLGLFLSETSAQSIIRQSINPFGSSGKVDGGVVSQTAGQVYFTNGFKDADIRVNPGFQQKMTAFIRKAKISNDLLIQLYPNPVSEELHLHADKAIQHARIEIMDMNGRIIYLSEENISPDLIIHLDHFTDGLYSIRITDELSGKWYNSRIIIIK